MVCFDHFLLGQRNSFCVTDSGMGGLQLATLGAVHNILTPSFRCLEPLASDQTPSSRYARHNPHSRRRVRTEAALTWRHHGAPQLGCALVVAGAPKGPRVPAVLVEVRLPPPDVHLCRVV